MDNTPHSWSGPSTLRKKQDMPGYVKGLLLAQGVKTDMCNDVKMPRKRTERGPRAPYRQNEAILRREVIKYLKKQGCKVWRIENSLRGNRGIPEIFFSQARIGIGGFIELKSLNGVLSTHQLNFQARCGIHGIKFWVIRSVEECR